MEVPVPMGIHTTDPPRIIFDPAPDTAQRLRRLSLLLLGNNTVPSVITTEDGAAPNSPAVDGEETDAPTEYPRDITGST